jgi:hypothetical protein
MSSTSIRVFYEDGRVAWTSFDANRDEVCPILWPSRREAEMATSDDVRRRHRESETYGAEQKAVHSQLGTILVDRARCVPVAVELVHGGVASWWTGLASNSGAILATNLEANEPRVKERGLFRSHPDYLPSMIKVTGPAWEDIDWSDVDCHARPDDVVPTP